MTDNNPYVRRWRAKGWLPPQQEALESADSTEARKHGADSFGSLSFDCTDCNAGEPGQCMKATFCSHRDGPQCEVLDEDWLADVIADSLDMDWTPRDGARAIIKALTNAAPSSRLNAKDAA